MSKTKTLFTVALLVLLGSLGAVQAQSELYEVNLYTTPAAGARAGGEEEVSGSVWLGFSPAPSTALITVTLDYSVPLADDIILVEVGTDGVTGGMDTGVDLSTSVTTMVEGEAENEDNDDNGTITITAITPGDTPDSLNLVIRGVLLDVSDASGTVTVTVKVTSTNPTDFIRIDGPSSATVIEDILVGVKAKVDPEVVRTRGTGVDGTTASLTLTESFKGAFMMGNMLEIESSGIPKGASLAAVVTNNPVAPVATEGDEFDAFPTSPYAVVENITKDGVVTVRLGGMDMAGAGDEDNNEMRAAGTTVVLALTLTAKPDNDDISFPLDVGSIMAKVTFTGDDSFTDAFTDYVTVFNIRPAQCELLFPVVSVLPDRGNWDTAISVNNPAYTKEMAAGGLMFTFYGLGGTVGMYDTTEDMVVGVGLEDDGTLAPGGTYQVMTSQILAATDWGAAFQGHVHLRADYTNCSGLGWVTDFMTVNQAYTATVIDADTGEGTQ